MSAGSYGNVLSEKHLQDLGYCMVTLATCFTLARLGIRLVKRQSWAIEDVTLVSAWVCSTAMNIGYIIVTPAVYRADEVESRKKPPYAGLRADSEYISKIFFPNTILLWSTPWLVKLALLVRCRQLIDRRHQYIFVWKWIVGVTVVFYVACIITDFTSCRTMHDWFTSGLCSTRRDARAAVVSLFFSFAADVTTDLIIMALPFRILWNLQMKPLRKLSVMAVFGVGTICIVTSMILVIQIKSNAGSRQPAPSWLMVWAMVEASVAVVVGCLPTFGLLFSSQKSSAASRDIPGSQSQPTHSKRIQEQWLELESQTSQPGLDEPVIEGDVSEGRLTNVSSGAVLVTTTLEVEESPDIDSGPPNHRSSVSEYHARRITHNI